MSTTRSLHGQVLEAAGNLAAAASRARAAGATETQQQLMDLSERAEAIAHALRAYEAERLRRGAEEERGGA